MFGLGPTEAVIVVAIVVLVCARMQGIFRGPRPFPFAFATVPVDDQPQSTSGPDSKTKLTTIPASKRRWTFTRWTLFVLVTLLAVLCGGAMFLLNDPVTHGTDPEVSGNIPVKVDF